ncbi:MAG: VWA domain-containing protein, partial [Planctomycetota bacterium]
MVSVLPELLAIGVLLMGLFAEWNHWRRLGRIRSLIFGPTGTSPKWLTVVPILSVLAVSIAVWGFASLWFVVEAEVHNKDNVEDHEYKHLVLVVDVSPSMHLADAGPEGDRTRRQRASEILESIFNRIPMQKFKISVIAVYSDAKLLLEDSKDHEVVRHIMEKMPMWHAYKPGKTKLMTGIIEAVKLAKPWPPGSAYVLMLTDGDTVPTTGMPKLPASINEFFVIGVGNSTSGSFIDGHQSRQDINTLRQVANRLRGIYHNGDKKHLTSKLVGKLTETKND